MRRAAWAGLLAVYVGSIVAAKLADQPIWSGANLPEQTARRLAQAGIRWDDPGLVQIRAWNALARERGRIRVETRRGQFGKTRLAQLENEIRKAGPTACAAPPGPA